EQFEKTHKELDLSAARAMVDLAKSKLPEQIVLTDPASYEKAAGLYQSAALKMESALAMAESAKPLAKGEPPPTTTPPVPPTTPERIGKVVTPPPPVSTVDPATAIARADAALKKRDYAEAFANYKIAADAAGAPNASAMCNVGLLYETGQGVERDYTLAARYY